MNSVSPVKTACGAVELVSRSYARMDIPSGVWPGVSRLRSRTEPISRSAPSGIDAKA